MWSSHEAGRMFILRAIWLVVGCPVTLVLLGVLVVAIADHFKSDDR